MPDDVRLQPIKRQANLVFTTEISLGAILQAATVAASIATGIYTAGSYVQSLRDDLAHATAEQHRTTEELCTALRKMMFEQQSFHNDGTSIRARP